MKTHPCFCGVSRTLVIASCCFVFTAGFNSPVLAQDEATVEKKEAKKPKWSTSASLGFTLTQGNTDSILLTANIDTVRKWDQDQFKMGASGAYGERDTTSSPGKVVDNQKVLGYAQYDKLFSKKLYAYGRVDGLHDRIADIDYRVSLGAGVGYYFIRNEQTELSVEVGPSYVFEKKGGDSRDYAGMRVGQEFSHKFNDRVRVWEKQEYVPELGDFGNFIWNAEAGVETKMVGNLSLRSYIQNTYVNEPSPGRKSNDFKFVTGIGYTF